MATAMYALYKLSQIALRPELWILGCMVLAWLAAREPRRVRTARRWLGAGVLLFLLLATPLTRDLFVGPLLAAAVPEGGLAPHEAIVVLSGGRSESQERVVAAVRLWRRAVAPVVVLSGGTGVPFAHGRPEAERMRDLALSLGVPDQALLLDPDSRTTSENAVAVRGLLPRARRVVVVSSRIHLLRAGALFRREGFDVTLVASDPRSREGLHHDDFLPSAGALADSREAIHEYVGVAVYALAGRLGPLTAPRSENP